MARTGTAISLPTLAMGQKHGLWSSGYHLIHPSDNDQVAVEGRSYRLLNWATPNSPVVFTNIEDEAGNPVRVPMGTDGSMSLNQPHLGAGIAYTSECPGEVGCWSMCDGNYVCQDPTPSNSKTFTGGIDYEIYQPPAMTYGVYCSTFGFSLNDYWGRATRGLLRKRELELETRLMFGDCVLDLNQNKLNPYLTQDPDISGVTLLAGGQAIDPSSAIAALEEALSSCNGLTPNMIHAPISVATLWEDHLDSSMVDYGDGMGPKSVLHTKVRGNIVVAGTGYTGTPPDLTSGSDILADGQAWIYGTSMVNIVWDKILLTPDEGDFRAAFNAGNTVMAVAEQIVGAFYDSCCNFAVLVDLTA